MKSARPIHVMGATILFLLLPCFAEGHSLGIIRLREARGSFLITVFTSSELLRGRPAEISVLVQKRDSTGSTEVLLDATVSLVLTPPRGSNPEESEPICGRAGPSTIWGAQPEQTVVKAQCGQSSNKLLYTAPINFPLAGSWQLNALICRGDGFVNVTCKVPVGLSARPLAGLIPYLALPPLLVALFAMNLKLRAPRPRDSHA
jgi:hypothetical protein